MNPSRQIVEAIFFGAASLSDAAERKAFLAAACNGDPQVLATVEKMLAAQDDAERFFAGTDSNTDSMAPGNEIQPAALAEDESPAFDERMGERIGNYKLVRKLGEGGCGAVYLAEQEEPVIRRVALKVIKLGMNTRNVIARFEAERQALALMDHPNIARVLDVGATRGRPFFVMELVDGTRITDFCKVNKLDLRQRLELFIQVCGAVQHAHQKGILHRDLKPSNILVTIQDTVVTPKVIDFGIATAIEGTGPVITPLAPGELLAGTPAYMSPEQMAVDTSDVDTRSDIYSLGMLLYELLTERTAIDGKALMRLGFAEMCRAVRETNPQRPSTVLSARQRSELRILARTDKTEQTRLIAELKRDLDWIVMKAAAKDRACRYETVGDLAGDLKRYLNDEPVSAHPPSRWYRFQKQVRRNQVVFAAGAAVALILVVGLGTSTWLFFKARQAEMQEAHLRQIAEEARTKETQLRIQTEARDTLTEAVIRVSQGDFEEAARQLKEMKAPPTRPTLDGISALRSVGTWLGMQGRWREAADRYSILMQIDELDTWESVTWDFQCCGAVLAETGNLEAYNRFRRSALEKFSGTANGIAAARILNACLLPPAPPEIIQQLQPLGATVEKWTGTLAADDFSGWNAIPISLWQYRQGDYEGAMASAWRGITSKSRNSAHAAVLHSIAAMACQRRGRGSEARRELARAQRIIESSFQTGIEHGSHTSGYWHDWVFARLLLREATALIERK
jgi:eukaryotic-like serine/threonine-protein kinase